MHFLNKYNIGIVNSEQTVRKKCKSGACDREFCDRALRQFVQARIKYKNSGNCTDSIQHATEKCDGTFCCVHEYKIVHVCSKSIGINDLRDLTMTKNMVVYCKDMSRFAIDFCHKEGIFILTVDMVVFMNENNQLINSAYKITKKHKKHLIQMYGKIKYFPKIKQSDVLIRYIGAQPKDVVCFERKNYTSVSHHKYYRLVS
jgi:DNA-directed RNA polymerase subunit H (RpoH/RPB5)